MSCPWPLADGVCTSSCAPARVVTRSAFNHRVERERRARFALAPAAVAAVHEQRAAFHAVAHVPAVAAALEGKSGRRPDHIADLAQPGTAHLELLGGAGLGLETEV